LEQRDEIELLDPDGKLAALFDEPEPELALPNVHRVRPATVDDSPEMEEIERLAFPTLVPPTRFRREIERTNTLYLLAVRDWTEEEIALGPVSSSRNGGSSGLLSKLTLLPRLPVKLFFSSFGGGREKLSPQYVAGIVGLWFVLDEAHVVIIGNRPGDRRKGIGELMLIAALEAAMAHRSRVMTLEVRGSNKAARALYHKYGFREVGVRKRYYADNNEDAVIMTTPPIQSEEYSEHFLELVEDHHLRWGVTVREA
jgi:ribosomal-protein-alanine N-acetyltransferase